MERFRELLNQGYTADGPSKSTFKIVKDSSGQQEIKKDMSIDKDYFKLTPHGTRVWD